MHMGILRTILALAVIVYHSYVFLGLRMCGGQVAVEAFYIISGFYMALILNEKYIGEGSYKKFILSRFYRIFPVYWFILLSAFLLSLVGYFMFNHPHYLARYISNKECLSFFTILYFALENIIVLGQDICYFLRLDEFCNPLFTYKTLSYSHTGYQYLFVPQAWSISVEFMFYIIAPFLVTKQVKWQLGIVMLGLFIKYYFANFHYLSFDPWTYRFFPFELSFFMAGSLAYKIYKIIPTNKNLSYVGYGLLSICILVVFLFEYIHLKDQVKASLFYCLIFISIPFIFLVFMHKPWDRIIGEYSFSLYISHHLIVSLFRNYFFAHPSYLYLYGYVVVFSSLIIAWMLQITLIKVIEFKRQKIWLT